MKILILKQWFDPEPTSKGLSFAKELQRQGHQVQILTGFPNYPEGKIYDGYKLKLYQREEIDGVSILRVALYPSHDSSVIKRIFNYISFAFMAMLFGIFATRKADIIYAYHPPLTVGIAAIFIKIFRRTPIVYDIQDMWPDTLQATGMLNNKKILNIVGWVCKSVYKFVDHIVVLSPGFKKLLVERGVPSDKINIIYNWCDEKKITRAQPITIDHQFVLQDKFNIIFAGNMGKAQALDTILDVAQALRIESKIQFVFVGEGTETIRLKRRSIDEKLDNVVFIPRMPMSQVGSILTSANILLVHLKKDILFEITVPSKTQAYMAIGKPILMAVSGDAADLIQKAQCGRVAISEDIESIKNAILEMYHLPIDEQRQLGLNAKDFYDEKLSLTSGVQQFIEVFERVKKC
ncbi:glycosyltransferase family 4 protein [Acinetobacter haemolyticus]|uniref:glycosyltransferase family 4 protein n=1 Tax=Acinetobacter haemolyticus TaxID=29430 RepID=UPI001331D5BC|nr:glycosyltransferase family 4 protein [Acinetobacter haemolyticus]NAR57748.1 glycosyltransferase [Acinetobacter haemolyticus]NAR98877.1 glycosyltransferase [Acinetobacter haemolyticus]NAS01963.1 glycosyltransferase [Acinetobacter haemolyticus]QHI34090.1 glycosyltransferase WbuB [Acinetobacter haemolyticus]